MLDNNNGWTTTIICILVFLCLYFLADSHPYFENPLTKSAKGIDYVLDESVELGGNALTGLAKLSGKVVSPVLNGAADVICGVTSVPERLLVGTANVTGDALIGLGKLIETDDQLTEEQKKVLLTQLAEAETEEEKVAQLKAAVEAGLVSSPFEGDMIKDLSVVSATEDDPDSQNLDVSMNGGAVLIGDELDTQSVIRRGPQKAVKLTPQCVQPINQGDLNLVDGPADIPELKVGPEFFGNTKDGDSEKSVENFYYEYDSPRYCTHCGGKGRFNCNNCENCGYCITEDGYGECVSGDANGPYFREDCIAYEHSANGYRTYKHSPYRYLVGLPYWRRDGYYHDIRGYPRTKYSRRTGSHRRGRRLARQGRRGRSRSRSGSPRSRSRTRDVVSPTGRSRSRSAYLGRSSSPNSLGRSSSPNSLGRSSSPRGRAGAVRVGSSGMGIRVGGGSRMGGSRSGGGRMGGSRMGGGRSGGGRSGGSRMGGGRSGGGRRR